MEWPNVKKVVKIKSRKKYPIILACMQKKHALKILLSFKAYDVLLYSETLVAW